MLELATITQETDAGVVKVSFITLIRKDPLELGTKNENISWSRKKTFTTWSELVV